MTTDSFVVRVARAIAVTQGSDNWMAQIPAARAALAAMREPTIEMLNAATPDLPDWGDLPEEWAAMIDQAMNEPLPKHPWLKTS